MIKSGRIVQELDSVQIKHLSTYGFMVVVRKTDKLPYDLNIKNISDELVGIEVSKNNFLSLISTLKSLSVDIIDISPIKNSLEDMFLKMG